MAAGVKGPALLLLVAGLLAAGRVAAETITLDGITFSDALGGFVLVSGSGSGRLDDPFVLVERITGDGPAVLTVTGLTGAFGNRVGTHHAAGFAVTKIVINDTGAPWDDYRIELQEVLGRDSSFSDGLSFAQGSGVQRDFGSDRFARLRAVDEPLDGIAFVEGTILPGGEGAVRFIVTDTSPTEPVFIVQRPLQPVAGAALARCAAAPVAGCLPG